jgi:hypothetical protein
VVELFQLFRVFLLEKGIDIPKEECITSDIVLKTSYLASYPHAMVPMLELDDGAQIGEALSIWIYLETLHPDPPLMGTTALEKAVISAWERRAYDEGMVGHAEVFRNSHPRFVDRGLPGHRDPVPQIPALIADITTITVVDSVTRWRCKFRKIAHTLSAGMTRCNGARACERVCRRTCRTDLRCCSPLSRRRMMAHSAPAFEDVKK